MLCIESEFDLCVLVAYIYIVFQGAYSLTLIIIVIRISNLHQSAVSEFFPFLPFFHLLLPLFYYHHCGLSSTKQSMHRISYFELLSHFVSARIFLHFVSARIFLHLLFLIDDFGQTK